MTTEEEGNSTEFPWHRCRAGESFFIPTLNPFPVISEGLRLGNIRYGFSKPPKAKFVIFRGQLGVMFTAPR